MPTIQQLVRKGRRVLAEQVAGFGRMSSASWRLCSCLHHDS